jgi:Flp pilus assembly protein TadB
MAQTKRKRRTKHRGTAAGTIQTRGRTGRPPTAEEKKKDARTQAREKRLNTPPTWNSSAKRAGIASALMFVFLMLTSRGGTGQRLGLSVGFAVGAFLLYSALGFYMDQFLYRRRMRKREAGE